MRIVHIFTRNLRVFEDALEGTGCKINGSYDVDYMLKSLPNYNARDVLGLIIFRRHLTKKTLKLIKSFDELFMFSPKPIIVACDDATALYEERKLRVKYSPLYLVDSLDGTVSDLDIKRIFTTLCCSNVESMYEFSDVDDGGDVSPIAHECVTFEPISLLAEEVLREQAKLGGQVK